MSPIPPAPKIYHITHVGQPGADHRCGRPAVRQPLLVNLGLDVTTVGMSSIKRRRLEQLQVTCHPGTKVGEYVPFYFCPRSIMLYILHIGNHPERKANRRSFCFTRCSPGISSSGSASSIADAGSRIASSSAGQTNLWSELNRDGIISLRETCDDRTTAWRYLAGRRRGPRQLGQLRGRDGTRHRPAVPRGFSGEFQGIQARVRARVAEARHHARSRDRAPDQSRVISSTSPQNATGRARAGWRTSQAVWIRWSRKSASEASARSRFRPLVAGLVGWIGGSSVP